MPADVLDRLFRRPARPYVVPLGPGPEPPAMIKRLDSSSPTAVLWGRWFDGGAILLSDPVYELPAEQASETFAVLDRQPTVAAADDGVLGGGWFACLGYAPGHSWVGFFDHLLRWRPATGWTFEALGLAGRDAALETALAEARSRLRAARTAAASTGHRSQTKITISAFEAEEGAQERHLAAIESAIDRIERGDYYQLNLCTRLRARFSGRPVELFAGAADRLRPAYGALLEVGDRSLISFSPELFLSVRDDHVRTAPIKGTSAVRDDPDGSGLVRSRKDVAENIMITDLMRNDLSRVCLPGTVRVERLLDVQEHSGVWQLVSTVGGALEPGTTRAALLRATFPPGSVTGAPKLSAQTGIAVLEAEPRGAYTGALGFCSPIGGSELSVIIRTFEVSGDSLELGVGGGITVDSVPIREWYECLHKAEPLIAAAGATLPPRLRYGPPVTPPALVAAGVIETMLVKNGAVLRMADHLARLDRSCRELWGRGLPEDLPSTVATQARHGPPRAGLRITVRPGPAGPEVALKHWPLGARRRSTPLVRANRPPWSWRHKWADRSALEAAERSVRPALPYFVAPDGYLAEMSRGNLFCRLAGDGWVTPPADEELLPGVVRHRVISLLAELGEPVALRRLPTSELHRVNAAFWTSSLSGSVQVEAIDGRAIRGAPDLISELDQRLGF